MSSSTESIHDRIDAALKRIEAVAQSKETGGDLSGKLDSLASENAALRNRHQEIGDRLDAAIKRLQNILKD